MCGICGFITKKNITLDQLKAMNDTMIHRGPDDSDEEIFPFLPNSYIGLAHRRLSIVDLSSKGHQPFHSKGNEIIVVFNGEIYNFHGKKVMPIGGAYSVDKYYRIRNGLPWFESEQPDEVIKEYVEQQLDKAKWNVDIVLSHTVPIEAEPVWAFIPGLDQSAVDKTTEKWLQKIYDRLDFTEWYAGHYHVESEECGIRIMYEDYDEICAEG